MGNSITHVLLGMMICLIVKSIFIMLPEFTYRFDFLQLLLSILEAARLPQRRRGKNQLFVMEKISIDGRRKFEPILRSKAKNFNSSNSYFVWRSSFDGAENGKCFSAWSAQPENSHKKALLLFIYVDIDERGGKFQRRACRRCFKNHTFDTIHQT